jgi:hypothetical protein
MKEQTRNINGGERTVFKVFWAWQDDAEEIWLEEMAKTGWHLKGVMPFVYTFTRGEPQIYSYRLDFKYTLDKDYGEYQTIFKDSGWELVALMSNWHYYRIRPDSLSVPEIYNDNFSKSIKYQRLLGILLPIIVVIMITVPPGFTSSRAYPGIWWDVVIILGLAIKAFFIFAVIRISVKIIQLRNNL